MEQTRCTVWDEHKQEHFDLRALLFVTINDWPALSNLSGQSNKEVSNAAAATSKEVSNAAATTSKEVSNASPAPAYQEAKYQEASPANEEPVPAGKESHHETKGYSQNSI